MTVCIGLWADLAEDQKQERYNSCCHGDSGIAEDLQGYSRRQS